MSDRPHLRQRRRARRHARGPYTLDRAVAAARGDELPAERSSLPEDFPYSRDKRDVDGPDEKDARLRAGRSRSLTRPFWGDIGVAPPASMGRINASIPGVHGGNMDNHDLVAGTSLFLPVHVPGALLSIGDGHAAQGNGEVGLSAIETSLKGEIQVVLHKGKRTVAARRNADALHGHRTARGPESGRKIAMEKCSTSSSRRKASRATMPSC